MIARNGKIVFEGSWEPYGTKIPHVPHSLTKIFTNSAVGIAYTLGKFDIYVTTKGGGIYGQAGAVRHGIARALMDFNPGFRAILKKQGLITRDPRVKERKKYGQRGARARYQFSKR